MPNVGPPDLMMIRVSEWTSKSQRHREGGGTFSTHMLNVSLDNSIYPLEQASHNNTPH